MWFFLISLLAFVAAQEEGSSAQTAQNALKWTEQAREAANSWVKTDIPNDASFHEAMSKIQVTDTAYGKFFWRHVDRGYEPLYYDHCDDLEQTIRRMVRYSNVSIIEAGEPEEPYLTTWKVTSAKDNLTRKCRIRVDITSGLIYTYMLEYDQHSELFE